MKERGGRAKTLLGLLVLMALCGYVIWASAHKRLTSAGDSPRDMLLEGILGNSAYNELFLWGATTLLIILVLVFAGVAYAALSDGAGALSKWSRKRARQAEYWEANKVDPDG